MRGPVPRQPACITGLGAVSGWGWGVAALWAGLTGDRSAIRIPERFDTSEHKTRLAAEVPGEEPLRGAQWSRCDRFALAAAGEAIEHAGLDRLPPSAGIFFGGSTAAMAEGERFFAALTGHSRTRLRLGWLASHQLNGPGDAVARAMKVTGPVQSVSSACASGALAVGMALDAVRSGEVEIALAGGADALCALTYAGFNALRAVDPDPSRPFRAERAGLSLGEGAGVVVIESEAAARRRGARVLACLLGSGASCDAHHMTAPRADGLGAARAIRGALEDSGVEPDDVGFVSAHGTGTPLNDSSETAALLDVFGDRALRLPVTSVKGSVGHLLGSSGAIEAVAAVQSLVSGEIHPTPGEESVDPELGVDLVTGRSRPLDEGGIGLSTSFAFGGSNAALLIGPPP